MDYSKLGKAYLNNDINWLKKHINLVECKELPIKGASGLLEEQEDTLIDICNWMFKNGLDVDATENNGNTGLIIACFKNKLNFVEMYINNNADVNKKCENNITPIIAALNYNDDKKIIKLLVEAGAELNEIIEIDGEKTSTIEQACCNCSIDILKYLLDNGASVEVQKEVIDSIKWDDTDEDREKQKLLKSQKKGNVTKSNMFRKIEEEIKALTEEEKINLASECLNQMIFSLVRMPIEGRFVILTTGARVGISSKNGSLTESEKKIIKEVLGINFQDDINDLYNTILEKQEEDYELIKRVSEIDNGIAIRYLKFILCFGLIDGELDENVAKKLDNIFGISMLIDFFNGDEESVNVTEQIEINSIEKEIIDWFEEDDNLHSFNDIVKHFSKYDKQEIKSVLDSLVEKNILYGGENIFGNMYGLVN